MRIQRTDLTAPLDIEFTGALGETPAVYSFQPQPDVPGAFACEVNDPIVIKRLLSLDGFIPLDHHKEADPNTEAYAPTVMDLASALEVISNHVGDTVTIEDIYAMVARNAPQAPELQVQVPVLMPDTDPQPEPEADDVDASAALDSDGGTGDGEPEEAPAATDAAAGEKLVDEAREARAIALELREPATLSEGRTAYKAMFGKAASPRFTFQQIKEALAKGPGSQE